MTPQCIEVMVKIIFGHLPKSKAIGALILIGISKFLDTLTKKLPGGTSTFNVSKRKKKYPYLITIEVTFEKQIATKNHLQLLT